MDDNYSHFDDKVVYIEANIPGPKEKSRDYLELFNNFNSQITDHCKCIKSCSSNTCQCLQKSGGDNYTPYIEGSEIKCLLARRCKEKLHSYLECNSSCSCSNNCGNRLVQFGPTKGLYIAPCVEKGKGLGLFTSIFLNKGTFLCEYAGELITKSQAAVRYKANINNGKPNYIFCLNEHFNEKVIQTFVDPSDFGNIGRYINHSCDPNCEVIPIRWDSPIPSLAIFPIVDLQPSTELTFSYGSYDDNSRTLPQSGCVKCLCNSYNCRGYMPFDNC